MTADENIRQTGAGEEKRESWQKSVLLYLHDLIYMLAVIMILFLLVFPAGDCFRFFHVFNFVGRRLAAGAE